MTLDEETRALLGYGTQLDERTRGVGVKRTAAPKPPKPKKFDGRHRRNWRRKPKEAA